MTPRRAPVLISACLLSLSCADLTAPSPSAGPGSTVAAPAAATASAAAPRPEAPAPRADVPQIAASHVLVGFKGALRAATNRSKVEARALAEKVRDRARKGEDFGALAAQYSDDPSGKAAKGSLGSFPRNSMVRPLSDAAALQPGQVSDVVETEFGYHVIKRTE